MTVSKTGTGTGLIILRRGADTSANTLAIAQKWAYDMHETSCSKSHLSDKTRKFMLCYQLLQAD